MTHSNFRTISRNVAVLAMVALVASCGSRAPRSGGGGAKAFATGPIYSACLKADRKAASSSRCGCVQAVANQKLSSADQSRAATFFANPQKAQDTRQADNFMLEAFWKRYKAYGASAAKTCG